MVALELVVFDEVSTFPQHAELFFIYGQMSTLCIRVALLFDGSLMVPSELATLRIIFMLDDMLAGEASGVKMHALQT